MRRKGIVVAEQVITPTDVETKDGPQTAQPGQYVVDRGGEVTVEDAEVFEAVYEPARKRAPERAPTAPAPKPA